jgi:putative transposase
MTALAKLPQTRTPPTIKLVTDLAVVSSWERATDSKRSKAELWADLLAPVVKDTCAAAHSVTWLRDKGAAGTLPSMAQDAYNLLAKGVSVPNLRRKLDKLRKGGIDALIPQHTGRQRVEGAWMAAFVEAFNIPSRPSVKAVYKQLLDAGYTMSYAQCIRYEKTLVRRLGREGIARVGKHQFGLANKNYQARHQDNMSAGDQYAGDGHTIDCYVAHPNTGRLFRPELTLFQDIKSRKIVGWWLGESENAIDTVRALAHAITTFNHVPPMLYLDHGAGYRAKLMSDECVGLSKRLGIDNMAARPGNPHGKGWIEQLFRIMRDEHDKLFDGGMAYCGDDAVKETNRRLSVDVKTGKRQLRSLADYAASLSKWIDRYNREPKPVLGKRSPNEVWAESFVRIEAGSNIAGIARPAQLCKVRRECVQLHGRRYYHGLLVDYQGLNVQVKYDLHDDLHVWIHDEQGRFICQADLTQKIATVPTSRIEQARDTAQRMAIQRKENDIAEIKARRQDAITVDMRMSAIDALTAAPPNKLIAPRAKAGMSPFKPKNDVQDVPYVHPADEASDDDFDIDITDYQP